MLLYVYVVNLTINKEEEFVFEFVGCAGIDSRIKKA